MPIEQTLNQPLVPRHLESSPDDAAIADIRAETASIPEPQRCSETVAIGLAAETNSVAHALTETIGELRHST